MRGKEVVENVRERREWRESIYANPRSVHLDNLIWKVRLQSIGYYEKRLRRRLRKLTLVVAQHF
jgi:hypothetical protein